MRKGDTPYELPEKKKKYYFIEIEFHFVHVRSCLVARVLMYDERNNFYTTRAVQNGLVQQEGMPKMHTQTCEYLHISFVWSIKMGRQYCYYCTLTQSSIFVNKQAIISLLFNCKVQTVCTLVSIYFASRKIRRDITRTRLTYHNSLENIF